MKKLATLLLLFASFLSKTSIAQTTACNAEFNVIYQTPNTVQFNPLQTGDPATTQHYWNFGDGGAYVSAVSPVHTYALSGTYTAEHIIVRYANGAVLCTDSFSRVVQIQSPCNLLANFTPSLIGPNAFHFQNTTTPLNTTDSVHWTFGDGSSSNDFNPTHTYAQPGTYTVCLRVQQRTSAGTLTNCVSEICLTIVVQNPTTCTLTANFYSYRDSTVANPFTYHFENTTVPLHNTDSIRWTFGDGTSTNQVSPNHTYTQPGTYTVCLRVQQRNTNGTLSNCVSEICHVVVVVQITNPCNLVANFYSYMDTTVTNLLTFHFENTSTPLNVTDSIRWTFGDGTSSNLVSPNHTYTQPGIYNVCLRIQQRNSNGTLSTCIKEICQTITVQATNTCNLVVNFTSTLAAGTILTYHFENTSIPLSSTDSIRWTFGDGTSSNLVSPNHTYTQTGTYTVCLRIQKREPNGTLTNCIREICHTIIVQSPTTCNLVASFYSFRDTLSTSPLPNIYHFVNTSTPLSTTDSIRWTFGDGTSSNQVNPTHSYTQPGTYTVCLRIQKRNSDGTLSNCIREVCHVVNVTDVCNIQVHFNWVADSINNRKIKFTNLTLSPSATATALWNFGDGSSATTWNSVHEYAQPGRYYVCLRVQVTPTCVGYWCDSVTVAPAPVNCMQQSNFSILGATGNSHLFYFIPNNINTAWQYTWTFGDGTGSHDITTSHNYTLPGNYTACLTVFQNANCASTTCKPVNITSQFNCDSVHVSYTYQSDPTYPNRFYFHTVSNYSVINETWTITRLPASSTTPPVTINQYNPVYVFNDTGYYRVCLRAVTSFGCIKEYCQYIHITQVVPVPNCNLQPYPNPATNSVSANVFLYQPQMIDVFIYNSMNVLVKEKHQQGYTGNNVVSLPIENLIAGIYTMKVMHGGIVCYAQFVKL